MFKMHSKLVILAILAVLTASADSVLAQVGSAGSPYDGMGTTPSALTSLLSAHDCTATAGNLVANCSFESGFTDWTVSDMANPLFPASVAPAGTQVTPAFPMGVVPTILCFLGSCVNPSDLLVFLFVSSPTQGSFSAIHGFDGGGPDSVIFSQTVNLTGGDCELQFDYRASWLLRSFGVPGSQDREFDVHVGDFSRRVLTAPGGSDSDMLPTSASVTIPGCGTSSGPADLAFEWFVPEFFTGPAGFELDNVQLVCDPTPSDCSGAVGDIGDLITGLGLDPALEGDLLATVDQALDKLDKGNIAAAIAQLRALLDEIEKALLDGDISAADASELFSAIIDVLAGLS